MIRRIGRIAVRAIFGLGLLVVVVTATPLTTWWANLLSENWTEADGDTLVVFGSELQPDGVIGRVSYWRTVYAVRGASGCRVAIDPRERSHGTAYRRRREGGVADQRLSHL